MVQLEDRLVHLESPLPYRCSMFGPTLTPIDFGSGGVAPPAPLLLDTYTGATAAYSLRKLRSDYTGNCIRVRRSSDSAEQDIGFASGAVDTTSLLTFCGAGDGFVVTRYDQAGSNDQTQAVAASQPKIVSSGAVIQTNGKPAIDWGLTGNLFLSFTTSISVRSAYLVLQTPDTTSSDKPFILADSATFPYHPGFSGVWLSAGLASVNVRSGVSRINGATVNLTSNVRTTSQIVLSMVHAATVSVSSVSKDRANSGRSWRGTRQEEIFWASDQGGNTIAIEQDMAAFYGITLS